MNSIGSKDIAYILALLRSTYSSHVLLLKINIFQKVDGGLVDLSWWPKINSAHCLRNTKTNLSLKSISETVLTVSRSQGIYYI